MNINILKHKKEFNKNYPNINLNIVWVLILITSVFAFIYVSYFCIGVFGRINKDFDPSSVSFQNKTEKVRKQRLEDELEYFSEQDRKSEKIIYSPSPFVDPSN